VSSASAGLGDAAIQLEHALADRHEIDANASQLAAMRDRHDESLGHMTGCGDLRAPVACGEPLEREHTVIRRPDFALGVIQQQPHDGLRDRAAAHRLAHDAREAVVVGPAQGRHDPRLRDDETTGVDVAGAVLVVLVLGGRNFLRESLPRLRASHEEAAGGKRGRDERGDRIRDRHGLRSRDLDDDRRRPARLDVRLPRVALDLHAELALAEDLTFDLELVGAVVRRRGLREPAIARRQRHGRVRDGTIVVVDDLAGGDEVVFIGDARLGDRHRGARR